MTEENIPSQRGRVFIVTGSASGIGRHLVAMLYRAGGKVYVAGRSEVKARQSIDTIVNESKESQRPDRGNEDDNGMGTLEYLHLELDDLSTIAASADQLKSKESRLDVLWNNAGVSLPPVGSVSKQGHELQMATNCLGPLLFTKMLLPLMQQTAAKRENPLAAGAVRIVWTSSQMVELSAPTGAMDLTELETPSKDQARNYVNSKTGNWFLAVELGQKLRDREHPSSGGGGHVLSVCQNPGNVKTDLLRHMPTVTQWMAAPLLYSAELGACTELWAGLSPQLTIEENGAYVIPWGKLHPGPIRQDLVDALKNPDQGGTGRSGEFRLWCEKQLMPFNPVEMMGR